MKQTSIEAYHSTLGTAETHRNMILEAMRIICEPVTSEDISILSGLRYDQTWRRMSELGKDGKVVCTELKGATSSGRMAHKWRLV